MLLAKKGYPFKNSKKKRRPPAWGGTPLSILVRQKILQKERHGRRAFASVNQYLAIPVPSAMKTCKPLIVIV
jgi:hypothetical protein